MRCAKSKRMHLENMEQDHTSSILLTYEGVSKSFRTESITKYTLTTINTRLEATQRVMAAKLTIMTHKIAIQLHEVAESCAICSSRSRWPVRKLLDEPSYIYYILATGSYPGFSSLLRFIMDSDGS
jgi:hypothetical protein